MFWGLRECRTINLQPIQQAEITIECAGAHITKEIKNVQKFPNFEVSVSETDRYKLIVVSEQKILNDYSIPYEHTLFFLF